MTIMVKEEAITGLLIGTADTAERAASVAEFFDKCPYCARAIHTGNTVLAVLSFPAGHRWWFESMAEDPAGTIGLQVAESFYLERINAQSPWSSGLVQPQLPRPPCGADCRACGMYKDKCRGCPASRLLVK